METFSKHQGITRTFDKQTNTWKKTAYLSEGDRLTLSKYSVQYISYVILKAQEIHGRRQKKSRQESTDENECTLIFFTLLCKCTKI